MPGGDGVIAAVSALGRHLCFFRGIDHILEASLADFLQSGSSRSSFRRRRLSRRWHWLVVTRAGPVERLSTCTLLGCRLLLFDDHKQTDSYCYTRMLACARHGARYPVLEVT